LSLRPLNDPDALAALYADPYIARVGHDHRPASPITHPEVHYIGAHVDGELVGAFMVVESGWIEHDVHALLTRRALRWSRDLGAMMLARMFDDHAIKRVTAQVIEGLESARNYCLRLGFRLEGFRRDALMVGGRLRGVYMLGLTRRDWESIYAA
jgi:hypothetical protein